MQAIGKYVVVKNLESEDVRKTEGGIFIANKEKPNLGHYEVISIGSKDINDLNVGDKIWALSATVSKSSNLDSSLGIIKYENIMAKD